MLVKLNVSLQMSVTQTKVLKLKRSDNQMSSSLTVLGFFRRLIWLAFAFPIFFHFLGSCHLIKEV